MSYSFTEGRYRAYVKSDFIDKSTGLSALFINSNIYPFESFVEENLIWEPINWSITPEIIISGPNIWKDNNNIYYSNGSYQYNKYLF